MRIFAGDLGMPARALPPALPARIPRFGRTPYADIFQTVSLTPAQQATANVIQEIGPSRDLKRLSEFMGVLENPEYEKLSRTKARRPFQNPFVDWYLNLFAEERAILLDALMRRAVSSGQPGQRNAMQTLSDLYYYDKQPDKQPLLAFFEKTVSLGNPDRASARLMQEVLRTGWIEWLSARDYQPRSDMPEALPLKQEVLPAVNRPLSVPDARPKVPDFLIKTLEKALLDPDPKPLQELSASGVLGAIIPEWQRATGPENVQHAAQDFTLDAHMLNAVAAAKQTPWYGKLSQEQKRLVTMATLLHDIGKQAGPANLRTITPPDRAHPFKSELMARRILPSLGFNEAETGIVCRLIRYHQVLGNMTVDTPGQPTENQLHQAAVLLETPETVRMLEVLTEADMRSVKKNNGWFTPPLQKTLYDYSDRVEARLQAEAKTQPQVTLSDLHGFLEAAWQLRTRQSITLGPDLQSVLSRMAQNQDTAGYSVAEGIKIIRVRPAQTQGWLNMPLDAIRQMGTQDGLYDKPLTVLHFGPVSHSEGLLVSVNPNRIGAALDAYNQGKATSALLQSPNAFRQIVSGLLENPALKDLHQARLSGVDRNKDTALLATHPHIEAVYLRLPGNLSPEMKTFLKARRLPLVLVD